MKIRKGFVSNSSSSSFTIGTRKDSLDDLFKKCEVKVSEDSPLSNLLKPLIREIIKTIERNAFLVTQDEWLEDIGYESLDEADENRWCKQIVKLFREGWNVYTGSFSSDSYGVEGMLCEHSLNYEDDDFIMIHEGGY